MPTSRGPRVAVDKGIYRDRVGYAVVVTRGSGRTRRQVERRFPFGTPLAELREERTALATRLDEEAPRSSEPRTLAHDAPRYLAQVKHLASYVSRRAEVRAWLALPLATKPRRRVTAEDVRLARQTWLDEGVAPKTVNHRVTTLAHLYRVLDGPGARTPCDGVVPLPVPRTIPQVVPAATVLAVDANLQLREAAGLLRSAKTRARFRVFVSTGKRPSEIMRAKPEHVDLERRIWTPVDGKGGFCPGVYLNDDMLAAWQLFAEANAWGHFKEGSWVKALQAAGWPKDVRVYHGRHTIGILMSEAGVDLADVSAHLGHKQIATTRKVYVPVLHTRLQKASEALNGRLPWAATGPRDWPPTKGAAKSGRSG